MGAAGTPARSRTSSAADGGTYQAVQTYAAADPASDKNQSFGGSVAVFAGEGEASYVAVAAPPGSASGDGIVYVARQANGGAWSNPPTALTNPSAQGFGLAIAFAGNGDLLVGDPVTGDGQVLVYAPLPDGGWASEGTLPFALDGGTVQQFGNGIATWNDLAVVAAPGTDSAGSNGAAFVFEASDAGVWTQTAVLTGASTESFGNFAPAVNGQLIAVGSAIDLPAPRKGQVDVWAQSGGAWVPVPSSALVGDPYYGEVAVEPRPADRSSSATRRQAAISDVTSLLEIETAVYPGGADGGVSPDGSTAPGDASVAADGSIVSPDGSILGPGSDAAAAGEAGAGAGEASASSSGCQCMFTGAAGAAGEGGSLAALGEGLALLVWARRRRAHMSRKRLS